MGNKQGFIWHFVSGGGGIPWEITNHYNNNGQRAGTYTRANTSTSS